MFVPRYYLSRIIAVITFLAVMAGFELTQTNLAAAGKKPDLVISAITKSQTEARAGGAIHFRATVKNRGKGKAKISTSRFYLSLDQKKSKKDILLKGDFETPLLKPGETYIADVTAIIPDEAKDGVYFILASADDLKKVKESNEKNNLKAATDKLTLRLPTSEYLIDKAVTDGKIDTDTGMVYKVYALFKDTRLPAAYKGDDEGVFTDSVMREAVEKFDSLTTDKQEILSPFLTPPFYEGSWASPASAASLKVVQSADIGKDLCSNAVEDSKWSYVETANGKAKVWWNNAKYPQMEAKAKMAANAIDNDIWPKLTGLMGEPLPDGGSTKTCRGGDDRLDIALGGPDQPPAYGITIPYEKCSASPCFVLIYGGLEDNAFLAVLAHEMMHTTELRFPYFSPCSDNLWLEEAVAQWAIDYVYHDNQYEQNEFNPNRIIDPLDRPDFSSSLYEAYTWPFFLAGQGSGNASIIRTIWENLVITDSLTAIDQAVTGGFKEQYPAYALYCWNMAPFDYFNQWDSLKGGEGSLDFQPLNLDGASKKEKYINTGEIKYLSALYSLWLSFPDKDIHTIEVHTPANIASDGGNLQIIYQMQDGSWKGPEDLTNKETRSFCRDKTEENIKSLVAILTNTTFGTSAKVVDFNTGKVVVKKAGCKWPKSWSGTFSGQWITQSPKVFSTEIFSTEAVFELEKEDEFDGKSRAFYKLVPGNLVDWSITGTYGGECTMLIPSEKITSDSGEFILMEEEDGSISIEGLALMEVKLKEGTLSCPNGSFPYQYGATTIWFDTGNKSFVQAPQDPLKTLNGTETVLALDGIGEGTYTWHLDAQW